MNPAAMPVNMAYWASKGISPAPDLRDDCQAGFPRVVTEGEESPPRSAREPVVTQDRGSAVCSSHNTEPQRAPDR